MNGATHNAAIPNPALSGFKSFIGQWKTEGTHPMMPNETLHGHASFEWMEGGAFLVMRAEIDHELFPAGIAIIGTDNTRGEMFMLYFDERKVSRKMDVSLTVDVFKWERTGPEFSQRYSFTLSEDGDTIVSKGEMSKDGANWSDDLDQIFTRVS